MRKAARVQVQQGWNLISDGVSRQERQPSFGLELGVRSAMEKTVRWGAVVMGLFYATAGAMHFAATTMYLRAMPAYLPAPRALVLVSGVAEIAGGLGVILPSTRRAAAWGLVLLLVAVMPANVWMAQHPERFTEVPQWALWARLPLQLPLIWWAWRFTKAVQ